MSATKKKRDKPRYFETRPVHAGNAVNAKLLEKIHADRAASTSVITWTALPVPSLDDSTLVGCNVALSTADVIAYERYVHLVAMSGVTPWSVDHWWAQTRGQVDYAFKRWTRLSRKEENERDEFTGSAAPNNRDSKRNRWMIGHVKQQCGSVQVGMLAKGKGDDTLVSVRTPLPTSEGSTSPLTSRVCHQCKLHLPAIRFAKKRGTIREVCKACDNEARVARRNKKNQN